MDASLLTSTGSTFDGQVAIGQSLEMVLPIDTQGQRVAFQIFVHRVHEGTRIEVERIPRTKPIVIETPLLDPTPTNWRV